MTKNVSGHNASLLCYCCSLFYHWLSSTLAMAINTRRLYRTMSHMAAMIISGYIPFDLFHLEIGVLWHLQQHSLVSYIGHLHPIMRATLQHYTLQVIQQRWLNCKYGRWTQIYLLWVQSLWPHCTPLSSPKNVGFCRVFSFFEFVPRIYPSSLRH